MREMRFWLGSEGIKKFLLHLKQLLLRRVVLRENVENPVLGCKTCFPPRCLSHHFHFSFASNDGGACSASEHTGLVVVVGVAPVPPRAGWDESQGGLGGG